ncbi:hypothetical protein NM688_g1056 [Phlebia brevispora]|uniref:Uncharacterized protein n=1 Tax=Phlebia brevispora TaxID=194682 RepID=A0ACC1TCL4_9APHY|nr:hypothetical protein NM688_g1056 [Phlebia brevispora]
MTYWSPSPTPSRASLFTQSHILRTLKVPQPTTSVVKALVAFYQEEQYWVHRTRTALKAAVASSFDTPDIFLASPPSDTSPDITHPSTPLSVPSRPPTSLSVSFRHDSVDDVSNTPMSLDVELTMDGDTAAHASSWVRRQNRMRLKMDGVTPKHKHRKPARAPPVQPSIRMLEMFSDLMDARMESCQRVSRLVEMRQYYYF